jgi:sarcosine oxidase, subunit alpha
MALARVTRHPILEVPEERRLVRFSFDGRPMGGFEGEMVSSALFANGVREFSIHRRGDAPQGIFCANGQCSQCTVVIDGFPQKSCVTALREGMDVRTLRRLPTLPEDDRPLGAIERKLRSCDVLVVGGGPSGLLATLELAELGFRVLLVDDKDRLGGKLVLQTHKFFGSIADCHAGTRGVDIARILEQRVRARPEVEVLLDTSVVGLFRDGRAGLFVANSGYTLVAFEGLVVSAGARERSLLFPGNDLPGVYGAGAFQTLVNRDLVRPAERVFIVGSGNVGLIAAYHALQAGISVAGICDILRKASGYKVHADKIRRMGVPIWLGYTVLEASADPATGRLAAVTIAKVDEWFRPQLDTAKSFAVDTLLVAVGLSPVDELYDAAVRYGYKVVKAGDAGEIAEASSAMFGGRIAGREMARMLGVEAPADPSWAAKAEVLKSRPGPVRDTAPVALGEKFRPIFHCSEEIPCNPCTSVCKAGAIHLDGVTGTILDLPVFEGECSACRLCVAICPGLAVVLGRKTGPESAELILPYEFLPDFAPGDHVRLTDVEGTFLEEAPVLALNLNRQHKTWFVRVSTSLANAPKIAGIRVQDEAKVQPLPEPLLGQLPENAVVCRCERVTVAEVVKHIRTHRVTDVNQLKQIRLGMGACGSKTCSALLPRVFAMAGVDFSQVAPGTRRPLCVEVPMAALVNEEPG